MHSDDAPYSPSAAPVAASMLTAADGGRDRFGFEKPAAPDLSAEALKRPLTYGMLLESLRHRWLLALTLGLVGGALGALAGWWFAPSPIYSSTAVVKLTPQSETLVYKDKSVYTPQHAFIQSQLLLLTNEAVLKRAVERSRLDELATFAASRGEKPANWLANRITARPNGEYLQIAVTTPVAADSSKIVDAVVANYIDFFQEKEIEALEFKQKALELEHEDYQKRLSDRRKKIAELANKIGSDEPGIVNVTRMFALDQLNTLEHLILETGTELQRTTLELQALEMQWKRLKPAPSASSSSAKSAPSPAKDLAQARVAERADIASQVEDAMRTDTKLLELQQQMKLRKEQYERLKKTIRQSSDPVLQDREDLFATAVKDYNAYRTAAQNQYRRQFESDLRKSASAPRTPPSTAAPIPTADLPGRILGLKDMVSLLTSRDATLKGKMDEEVKKLQALSQDYYLLKQYRDEAEVAENASKDVAKSIEALKIEKNAPARVNLVTAGDSPKPVDPRKLLKMMMLGGSGAAGAMVFLVTMFDVKRRRIYCNEVISQDLGLKVVGMVPKLPKEFRRGSYLDSVDPSKALNFEGLLRDSIDDIRAQVLMHRNKTGSTAILLTSPMPREGKSTIAASLAESLARTGFSTLLVDCDLRRPVLHEVFDSQLSPGLGDFLAGKVSINEVVKPTSLPKLWLTTAGDNREEGVYALSRDKLRDFRADAMGFDFILFDTAPILPVHDTLMVTKVVDGILLVIMRNNSRLPWIYESYQRLRQSRVPIIGAILNGVPVRQRYGYEYGYRYGYGYGRTYGRSSAKRTPRAKALDGPKRAEVSGGPESVA